MPISGSHGAILVDGEELPHVRHWLLTRSSDNRAYASSSTGGHTCRVAGLRDWSVTFEIYSDTAATDFAEGDEVQLRLYAHKTAGRYYEGQALIDTLRPMVDIEGGKIVGLSVTASANGPLTEPT